MMTVKQIYDLAVKMGIQGDPRPKSAIQRQLKEAREEYNTMAAKDKVYFDTEYLTNPYSDTRIVYAKDVNHQVKRMFAGIDCEGPELLLANHLGNIDLVLSHHPEGIALADLPNVMELQVDMLGGVGVPVHIAENLLTSRIAEVNRGVHPINDQRNVDIARLLNIPYLSTHTVTDNLVTQFIDRLTKKHQPQLYYVSDILDLLMTIPEYQIAKRLKSGPTVFIGGPKRRVGKIAVTEMTGGTNGAKEMFEQLSRAGIGTLIGMHMREDHRKEAEKHHINVVIAGHISSDSLGMNLLLDKIEKRKVEIIPLGGLIRVKRFKK